QPEHLLVALAGQHDLAAQLVLRPADVRVESLDLDLHAADVQPALDRVEESHSLRPPLGTTVSLRAAWPGGGAGVRGLARTQAQGCTRDADDDDFAEKARWGGRKGAAAATAGEAPTLPRPWPLVSWGHGRRARLALAHLAEHGAHALLGLAGLSFLAALL